MDIFSIILQNCFRVFQSFPNSKKSETLHQRLLRYIHEVHRDGVMDDGRYAVALGKAEKLRRFLFINNLQRLSPDKFTTDLVLQFRQFIYDEYTYVLK